MTKKRLFIITAVVFACIIGGIFAFTHFHHRATLPQPAPIRVVLGQAKRIKIANQVSTTGTLVANQQANISAKVSGYVTHINYFEGKRVKANTVLIQLDRSREENNVAAAKANLAMTLLQLKRDKKLLKKGFILQQTYYQIELANQKNLAQYKTALTALKDKTITAPFSGIVGAKTISIGDFVNAGQKLVTLVNTQNLEAEYTLPSRYMQSLQLGQQIVIRTNTLSGKKFTGKVTYIAPSINPLTQTIAVHARLHNKNGLLKPGQFVTITQRLSNPKRVLVIPTQSVVANLAGNYVFSVNHNRAVKISVSLGKKFNGQVVVTHGLKPGQAVVVAGQDQLKNGSAIKVNPTHQSAS